MQARLPELPINVVLPQLLAALARRTSVLVDAPPGAGKSTIVPLALLEQASWLQGSKILMLEPRRIAARTVAARMAALLGEEVGQRVGYRTRVETRISRRTRIEVVTEGVLTRMLQTDAALEDIGCVIFDEFHERSLNADLGLALCLDVKRNLREELRILVMSATLDLRPLSTLLDEAPIVSTPGRAFEVATHYIPRRSDWPLERQVAQSVRHALDSHDGDILCFLPGAAEIRRVMRNLEQDAGAAGAQLLPLYADLPLASQDAALAPAPPGARRKIVLATSIAETSVTIEGIRVVIDSGLRRYSEFDPTTGMSRLATGKISQAAADQRRGRAGRLSSGSCYRLWSEASHASLPAHTPPEILHADLAPLALELACWGSTDVASLAWLDAPPAAPLGQARQLLQKLGAIDSQARITPHGRALAGYGMHPRLAHMVSRSLEFGAARLGCDLAAILSERDILRGPADARDADLRLRVAVLRGDQRDLGTQLSVDEAAVRRARQASARWQRELGRTAASTRAVADTTTVIKATVPTAGATATAAPAASATAAATPITTAAADDDFIGVLLGSAFPDRIARRRGAGGRYLLANGRGAGFGTPQALDRSEFIVAAELDDSAREARIFLAAPIAAADLEQYFGALIEDTARIEWDERDGAVHARRTRALGAVTLDSAELRSPDPRAMQRAALEGLRLLGIGNLPWSPELLQWRARVELMRKCQVAAPEPWPDVSDTALAASSDQWAVPCLRGITRREHFANIDLNRAIRSSLSPAQSAILEREAPTHFTVPSGSRIPIDYRDGDTPTLSVRLQELFGLTASPHIANGKLPLLLKLLSPAGRPVQITRDLLSFWRRGYQEVKKDLKGRYPKHHWPDDPFTAAATRRARLR